MKRSTRTGLVAGGAALVLAVAAGLWWIFGGDGTTTVTAQFSRAVGVYPSSDVRVLGVRVGQVESVTPRGELVDVVLTIDAGVPVPADTKAAVVAPSVVADRYVQFAGGTKGAARLADGAVIPVDRTAVPVELDELYASLDDLLSALGPQGANSEGALSELLDTGAENLDGHGQAFNDSVRNLAELSRTLAEPDEDLFATVDQLQQFTSMLAGNDRQVASANQQLAQLTRTLAADRDELAAALASLPLAATNVLNAFDPESGTLQGRVNLLEYLVPTPPAPAAAQPAVPLPLVPGGR